MSDPDTPRFLLCVLSCFYGGRSRGYCITHHFLVADGAAKPRTVDYSG